MSRLALYLLGSPEVQLNDNAVVVKERKALALLIYLGVTGAPHRRETLATLLWPEYSYKKGRTNLRRVLYVLRQAIGDDWLKIEGESVSLSPAADFWIDIGEFTELASQYPGHLELDQSDLDSLERAVSLYRGDFLAGFAIADSPAFDEWQFFESETARQSLLTVLDDLIAEYSHRSDYEAALGHARRRLVLDPLHEPAQQNMMRLYALCGQQAAALRQYDLCMQIFEKELGLPPSEETTNLFEQIRAGTVRRDELLASTDAELEPVVSKSSSDRPHIDRHEAPDVPDFFGRESELAQLETWVVEERCRLIVVLGMGGLGKTTLTAKLTHHLVDELTSDAFDQVLWRSLLNAPRLSDLLPEILQFLSRQQLNDIPSDLDQRFDLLLAYLREQRCLLILDNAESLLQEGAEAGAYRPDYEDYGQLFMRVAQHTHQSCLLVTSREAPLALRRLAQESHHVQLLNLGALSTAAGQRLLLQRGLTEGSAPLIDRYSGNPLALKLVADTIEELFFGDVDSFLTDETLIFDDIRTVLAQQMDRLTPLEEEILLWLAIERGPVTPSDLWENLLQPESRRVYIEALGGLQRRSLLEKGDGGFALQNVITEFLTERLVDQFCTAIEEIRPEGINHHALIKAQAKEHVRQSQVRLILKPIAERLLTRFDRSELETNLATIRENIRSSTTPTEGYAGGNILNLLLQADGDLTGADFSKMAIWQAYLRGVNLQDVDFREADLSGSLFTDTFGQISSVDISPDGLLVAAGGSDGRIWVWRLADGQLQLTCEGHTDCIWSVCFSPDGRLIASGSRDRTVRIWSASTGEELAVLRGHTGMIWSVAFSPDGKTLASGAQTDNTLKLWDVAEAISLGSSQLRETLRGHSDTIRVVRFSPDGRLLASGCQDHSIRLWRADGGQELARLDGHSAGVWAVAFSPDGTRLASGGEDDLIHLWNIAKTAVGREVRILETLHGHEGWVRGLSFSPDGSILASAAEDRTIRIWDVPSSQLLNVLHGHTSKVTSVCYSPKAHLLASGGDDMTVRIWDVSDTNVVGSALNVVTLRGYANRTNSICFSTDGTLLATGGTDGIVRLWDWRNGRLRQSLKGHTDQIYCVSFSPDGSILASCGWDQTVRLWDAKSGRTGKTLLGHSSDVRSLCFSPDGKTLASSSEDQTVRLWDVASGQPLMVLNNPMGQSLSISFNGDGTVLVGTCTDGTIRFWDVQTGENVKVQGETMPQGVSVNFSPDGCFLAVGFVDGTIRLWDAQSDEIVKTLAGHSHVITSTVFSPNGQILISSSWDKTVRIWDIENGQCLHTLSGHHKNVHWVALNPTIDIIASCSYDDTIRIWDAKTGVCLDVLRIDRPYERTNITGVTGLTTAQRASILALGAVEDPS